MEKMTKLVLLSLGLFMMICCVNSQQAVQVFGKHTSDDPMIQLDNLKAEKQRLERDIERTEPGELLNLLQMRLKRTNWWINEIMDTSKVLYKDYLRMMAEQETKLEKGLTEEKDRIAKEFAEHSETQNQHLKRLTEEKNQLIKEREEMIQKLKEAQDLHSQALEAMVVNTQEGYKLASIPYQKETKYFRGKLDTLLSKGNDKQRMNELLKTQTELQDLLRKLYEDSHFSAETDFKDLEAELAEMEVKSLRTRDEHNSRKNVIVQNMKNKGLANYNAEEVASLKQVNEEVAQTHKNLQEIARRSAYLKAISQVAVLAEECSNAIKEANTRAVSKKEAQGKGFQVTSLADAREQAVGLQGLVSLSGAENEQSIHDVIKQRSLLYKDLLEFYRTKLSTEIVNGLAKVNKLLPIPFPGCSVNRLVEIRDRLSKWAERVQYALRLSKKLYKYDNRSMIVRFFSTFLANLRNTLYTLAGKKVSQKSDLDDDEERTRSVEEFEKEGMSDFYKNYQYVKVHLMHLLDIDAELDEEQLREVRYNFIFVRKVPDVLVEASETMLEEVTGNPSEENERKGHERILEEIETSSERLHLLFGVLIHRVNTTTETQHREYQAALEEYKQCRLGLLKGLPLFRNIN